MTGSSQSAASDSDGQRAGGTTYVGRALIVIAFVAAMVVIGIFLREQFLSSEQLLERAVEALNERPQPDFESARSDALRILDREPDSNRANLIVAGTSFRTNRLEEALEYAGRIPDDGSEEAVEARCLAGDLLLNHKQQPSAAFEQFQRAFDQDARSATAREYLAHLHRLACRTVDQQPHSVFLARNGLTEPQSLYELNLGHELHTIPSLIEDYGQVAPDDPIVLLGQADIAMLAGDLEQAAALYRRVMQGHPDILAAHVRLGSVFLESRDAEGFYDWHSGLTDEAEHHPLTWWIRGAWAELLGDSRVAIRCFWESVRLDPNHRPAVYRLARLLIEAGQPENAEPFLQRSHLSAVYSQTIQSLILLSDREEPDLREFFSATHLAGDLGLFAEANAWVQFILQQDPSNEEAQRISAEIRSLLPPASDERTDERTIAEVNPAGQIDLSEFPLPDWTSSSSPVPVDPDTAGTPAVVTFEDQAAAAGINFNYFKGGDPAIRGLTRVYRFTGGGVAVLDLDCDGWPDIHLTQATDSPEQLDQAIQRDHLYRNTGQGQFTEVSESARLVEERYSQGAAVGDFNGDGFADLRIANIGGNRLYQNNGDGTFEDISEAANVASRTWTTSCLLADLNGDGLPDLYDVNFLAGDDVLTTVCRDGEGDHHACLPLQFLASPDELFLNHGDGTFTNVTQESGILAFNGRGTGIVAADFDGQGKLNLFIANNNAANSYFVNESQDTAAMPGFSDQAVPLGAAYDREGRAETGMGVAAGDTDQDGLLELFVANSYGESNTLYDVQPENLFVDTTWSTGLAEPGQRMSGYGTQFIDGALRGSLDLIVANGHNNSFDFGDIPYEMPPQYFSNIGSGRFVQSEAASLGPYFEGVYLGRALARVDWNRDGREDVVMTHLDAPTALLTNTTEAAGRFLALRLIGRQSARDAIGTSLTLIADDGRTQHRQLTAGDGYQASNQRIIVFGLAGATAVDSLQVRWPSGLEQQFSNIDPDREYICVEGMDRMLDQSR